MSLIQKIKTATYSMTGSPKIKSALASTITALGEVPQSTRSNPSQTPIPGRYTNQSVIFSVFGTVTAALGLGLTGCMLFLMYKERKENIGGERIASHGSIDIENDRDFIANDDTMRPHSEDGSYPEGALGEEQEGNNSEALLEDV